MRSLLRERPPSEPFDATGPREDDSIDRLRASLDLQDPTVPVEPHRKACPAGRRRATNSLSSCTLRRSRYGTARPVAGSGV